MNEKKEKNTKLIIICVTIIIVSLICSITLIIISNNNNNSYDLDELLDDYDDEESYEDSVQDEAYLYIDAIEKYIALANLGNSTNETNVVVLPKNVTCKRTSKNSNWTGASDNICENVMGDIEKDFKGNLPDSVTIKFDENNFVGDSEFEFDGYTCSYDSSDSNVECE